MDNKRRLYRLLEVYLNGFKSDLVESIYGKTSYIKVHTVTFGISDNSVLVELVVLLGDVIKGSVNKYLYPVVGIIVLVSLVPLLIGIYKERKLKNN